jgi:hypothetical protein
MMNEAKELARKIARIQEHLDIQINDLNVLKNNLDRIADDVSDVLEQVKEITYIELDDRNYED